MIVHRAAHELDYTGRTVEGIAYRYNYPSRVTDDFWVTSYFEEMLSGADSRTLSHRSATFPLVQGHKSQGGTQVGTVTFARSDDERALMFTGTVDHGTAGDELLADIDTWRDASVTFEPIRTSRRMSQFHGEVIQRAEVRFHELALTPAGTGLAKGAEVLAVRAAVAPATPLLDDVRRRMILLG